MTTDPQDPKAYSWITMIDEEQDFNSDEFRKRVLDLLQKGLDSRD